MHTEPIATYRLVDNTSYDVKGVYYGGQHHKYGTMFTVVTKQNAAIFPSKEQAGQLAENLNKGGYNFQPEPVHSSYQRIDKVTVMQPDSAVETVYLLCDPSNADMDVNLLGDLSFNEQHVITRTCLQSVETLADVLAFCEQQGKALACDIGGVLAVGGSFDVVIDGALSYHRLPCY